METALCFVFLYEIQTNYNKSVKTIPSPLKISDEGRNEMKMVKLRTPQVKTAEKAQTYPSASPSPTHTHAPVAKSSNGVLNGT